MTKAMFFARGEGVREKSASQRGNAKSRYRAACQWLVSNFNGSLKTRQPAARERGFDSKELKELCRCVSSAWQEKLKKIALTRGFETRHVGLNLMDIDEVINLGTVR